MEHAPWYTWAFEGVGVLLLSMVATGVWRWIKRRRIERGPSQRIGIGAGTSVFGSPVAYGRDIVQNVTLNAVPLSRTTFPEYRETPTPEEIRNHLRSLPVYQQLAVKDSYLGINIRWTAYLRHLAPHPTEPSQYMVFFGATERQGSESIICVVRLEDFPRLQIAKAGDEIIVTGTVSKIDFNIELRDVRLNFPERPKLPVRNHQNVEAGENDLTIISAKYGAGTIWADVAPQLRTKVQQGKLRMQVINEEFGHDPVINVVKSLQVTYSVGGRTYSKTVPETQMLILPE